MTIQEFANLTGLTVHTLRYYEQIGLLGPVPRTAAGHRHYGRLELDWVNFIKRLKATEMPLRDIMRYAELRQQGEGTLLERQALLAEHAERLAQRLREQQGHLTALQEKISFYQQQLANNA